jgi:hypothetical protein
MVELCGQREQQFVAAGRPDELDAYRDPFVGLMEGEG